MGFPVLEPDNGEKSQTISRRIEARVVSDRLGPKKVDVLALAVVLNEPARVVAYCDMFT